MEENKNKKNKKVGTGLIAFFVIAFTAILTLPTIIWGVLMAANLVSPSIMEKLDYDTGENRTKSSFTSDSGANMFFENFEQWYNDRVPFRAVILSSQKEINDKLESPYSQKIRPALIRFFHPSKKNEDNDSSYLDDNSSDTSQNNGLSEIPDSKDHKYRLVSSSEPTCYEEGRKVYKCKDCGKEVTITSKPVHQSTVIKTVEASVEDYGYTLNRCSICGTEYRTHIINRIEDDTYLPYISHGYTFEGKSNWLFYNGDNSIEYYKGSNLMSVENLKLYSSRLKKLKDICDEKGIKLQYMILPNKEQIYSEFMPSIEIENEIKRIDRLVEYVRNDSGINILYPYNELMEAKPYWQLYRKHDTHWNNAGAFIGTQSLYKALGLEVTDLMSVKVNEKTISGGDLIKLGNLSTDTYASDTNYDIDYKNEISVTQNEGKVPKDDILFTKSTAANKCNFVMIGDSFRKAMIPYIEKDFSNCMIAHKNKINDYDVIDAIKKADVLVISTIERQDETLLSSVNSIIKILTET